MAFEITQEFVYIVTFIVSAGGALVGISRFWFKYGKKKQLTATEHDEQLNDIDDLYKRINNSETHGDKQHKELFDEINSIKTQIAYISGKLDMLCKHFKLPPEKEE